MPLLDNYSLDRDADIEADVCIVGAGAAGLVLAAALRRHGVRVVVLEAGPLRCVPEHILGVEAIVRGAYRASTHGRAFGLGGTTVLWGGQLIPHTGHDLRENIHPLCAGPSPKSFDFWQFVLREIQRYTVQVYALLGLRIRDGWFEDGHLLPRTALMSLRASKIDVLTSDWLPFRRRSFRFLAQRALTDRDYTIFVRAPVYSLEVDHPDDLEVEVVAAVARGPNHSLRVRASAYVLAAGAIETTRTLLDLEARLDRPLRPGSMLGRCLGDHLSACIARVDPTEVRKCVELFGPRFEWGRMRSFRFLLDSPPRFTPRAFFHFVFLTPSSAFAALRAAVKAIQERRVRAFPLARTLASLPGVVNYGWHMCVRRRLFVPGSAEALLRVDFEQWPNPDNRIVLSERIDRFGRPRPVVQWVASDEDYDGLAALSSEFIARWSRTTRLVPRLALTGGRVGDKPYDVYHPVGTCRLGADQHAVVAPSLVVYGTRNLFVLSTAMFPTAGTANPTFSLLCLACSLAERLAGGEGRRISPQAAAPFSGP